MLFQATEVLSLRIIYQGISRRLSLQMQTVVIYSIAADCLLYLMCAPATPSSLDNVSHGQQAVQATAPGVHCSRKVLTSSSPKISGKTTYINWPKNEIQILIIGKKFLFSDGGSPPGHVHHLKASTHQGARPCCCILSESHPCCCTAL